MLHNKPITFGNKLNMNAASCFLRKCTLFFSFVKLHSLIFIISIYFKYEKGAKSPNILVLLIYKLLKLQKIYS